MKVDICLVVQVSHDWYTFLKEPTPGGKFCLSLTASNALLGVLFYYRCLSLDIFPVQKKSTRQP